MGLVGESKYLCKLLKESTYVNGLSIEAIYSDSLDDGEGIRYELVAFVRAIDNGRMARYIEEYGVKMVQKI